MLKNILLYCLVHFIFLIIIRTNVIQNNNTEKNIIGLDQNNTYLFAYLLLLDIVTFKNI